MNAPAIEVSVRFPSGRASKCGQALVLALVVFGAVLIAAQNYRAFDGELTDAALAKKVSVAHLAATVLTEKFDRLTDVAVSLATRVRFRELVSAGQWDAAIHILRSVPADLPVIERVFLTNPGGTLMADFPELPGTRGQNFAHRDWYQGVSRNWEPYVSHVYQRAAEPKLNVIAVVAPVKDKNGEVSGILGLQVRLETFFEWAKRVQSGPGSFIYVVDKNGRVAFHPKFAPQGELPDFSEVPIVRQVLQGKQGVEISFNPIEEEQRVAAFEPVARYGWGVLAVQPVVMAFAIKNHQLRRILFAYGLILLFCLGLVYLASRMVIQRRQADEDRRTKAELERRIAERTAELASRTAQLEAANKELESFSYSVSHDLRAPLRAVDGFSRMLEEDYADKLDEEGKRILKTIREGGRKMGQLIDDLLAFSRLSRKRLATSEVDMRSLAQQVFAEMQANQSAGRARLVVDPMPPACGDPVMLRQVWVNLLANGIKFSSPHHQPEVTAGAREDTDEAVYHVKDNGVGFDMRYYDKLFGAFQRLHREEEFPGTGVGLAIVQRVVARHGGRVWAESTPDQGATFYFALPKRSHDE
jgi:signal transduction histidine kinase